MRRRSRLLRVAKWGGVSIVLAIGIAMLLSHNWNISWGRQFGSGWYLTRGFLGWTRSDASAQFRWPDSGWNVVRVGWHWRRPANTVVGGREPITWWCPKRYVQPGRVSILVPLWMPVAIIGMPAAGIWWIDRRRPLPGHCPCGYDLTGNVSGVRPECGKDAEKIVSTAVRAESKQP